MTTTAMTTRTRRVQASTAAASSPLLLLLVCSLLVAATQAFFAAAPTNSFLMRPRGALVGDEAGRRVESSSSSSSVSSRRMVRGDVKMMAAAKPLSGRSLYIQNGADKICYDVFYGTRKPAVMYLPCLFYPKNNAKATNLENWCKRNSHTFVCADYYGVARSSGDFAAGTVSRWTEDTIFLIERLITKSPVILVGSGVGGWISLLVASKRPDLVAGLVTMAADPDFTEDLLWKNLAPETKQLIMDKGVHEITWGVTKYPISRSLIEDGRSNFVLRNPSGGLGVTCPVRIIHSLMDEEVPFQTALKLADCVQTKDVKVILSKSGSHFLDEEEDFYTMREALVDVVDHYFEYDLTTTASG